MPPEEPDGTEATEPEDAFALIGNATRADILRVLGEAGYDELPFSELRSRVDEEMDSGQFNYHLQQLLGQFVERTDDGYQILPEGMTLYRTIRAGTFNRRATVGPFDAGFDCYYCDDAVEAGYEDGMFEVACPGCEHVYSFTRAPPSAVEGADPDEFLARIDQYNRHEQLACVRGVCPHCVNPVRAELLPGDDLWLDSAERYDAFVEFTCEHCGYQHYLTVGHALLHDPAVIAFLETRGVDVEATPHWEFEFAMTDRSLTVRSRDPWEVALTVTVDGDTMELVVDDRMNVVETNRPE